MQGSGKTLFLVRQAYIGYKKGKKIYSNVDLNFPYKEIDYNDIVNCKYENAIVILDEIHQLLPSRRSMSDININICDGFLSMVRKKGLEIFGSTQTQRKVDIRFREESDYIYLCEKWAHLKGRWAQVTESEDLDINIPIMISVLACQTFSGSIKKFYFEGNPLYDIYNTRQIIQVRGIKLK
jgi:hypothetical protein